MQPVRKALELSSVGVLMLLVAHVLTGGYTAKVSVWVLLWACTAAVGAVFVRARSRERRASMEVPGRAKRA
jgi:hypothetical protein